MSSHPRGFLGLLTISAALLVSGCGSTTTSNVRAVNASPGLSQSVFQVGTIPIAFNIPYGTVGVDPKGQYTTDASGIYREVGTGTNQLIALYAQLASSPLATGKATLVKNSNYTVVSLASGPQLHLLTLTDDNSAPSGGNFKLRLMDASPSAGSVDVYLTAPGANLPNAKPLQTDFLFGQVTQTYFEIAPASYELRVTPTGDPSAVLIDVPFAPSGGNVYTAFLLDPPAGGAGKFGALLTHDPLTAGTMSSGTK